MTPIEENEASPSIEPLREWCNGGHPISTSKLREAIAAYDALKSQVDSLTKERDLSQAAYLAIREAFVKVSGFGGHDMTYRELAGLVNEVADEVLTIDNPGQPLLDRLNALEVCRQEAVKALESCLKWPQVRKNELIIMTEKTLTTLKSLQPKQ